MLLVKHYGVLPGNVVYRTTHICIKPTENSLHPVG